MKFDEKPAVGDRVSLRDDLGFQNEFVPRVRARLTKCADRFSLSMGRLAATSEETLEHDRRWNESQLTAGEEVRTRIDLFQGDLAYQRRVLEAGDIELWAGAAARYVRLEAIIHSSSQGSDDDHAITFAPAVRVTAGWAPASSLRIEGELEATSLPSSDFEVRGGAGAISATWRLSTSISLRLGWRLESLKLTKDISLERNDFRARVEGVVFGVEFAW